MIETPSQFVRVVSQMSFDNVFNPYAMRCSDFDRADAPKRRRKNLEVVLHAAMERGVDSIWIGRDLGYRGGRRTGLALTDELHLTTHAAMFAIDGLDRATKGPAVGERTATVVWDMLRAVNRPVFLWNVFPFHPHAPESSQSNRAHTRSERQAARPLLLWLLETLNPKHVVAIGKDAQSALADLEISAACVRHPSYGGQRQFESELTSLYKLPCAPEDAQPKLI